MHLGDAAIVAGDEAQQDFGEEAPLLQAEPAHDAEIDRDQPAGIVEEQIAGMHVGMKEAVAQRVAQEALDHLAAEIGQIDLRLLEPRMVAQRDAVDPFHRQHIVRGAVPVDRGHAKVRIVAGVLRHLGQRGGFEPQIHFHRDRARHRVDDFDQPQPPRFRRIAPRPCARQRRNRARSRRKRAATLGRSTLTATGLRTPSRSISARCTCAIEAAATAGPKLANACANGRSSDARDHGFGLGLRKRRQPVLQAFQVARHDDADHVGPRGEKLSELEIGRPEPRQRARQPRAGLGAAAARSAGRSAARAGRAAAPGSDRRRRTRLRARTRNRRGPAARCG